MIALLRIGDIRADIKKLQGKLPDLLPIDPLKDNDNDTRRNFKIILKELKLRRAVERMELQFERDFGLNDGLRGGDSCGQQRVFEGEPFIYPDPIQRLEEEKAVLEAEVTTLKTALDMAKRDNESRMRKDQQAETEKPRTSQRRRKPTRKGKATVTHHRLEFTEAGVERVKPVRKPIESRKRPLEHDDPYGAEAIPVNRDPFSATVPVTDADLGIEGVSNPNYPSLLTHGSQPFDWDFSM